jgi:putative SOS response-associated peptidase YedK
MEPIHKRMPMLISSKHWQHWLAQPVEMIERLVVACPD